MHCTRAASLRHFCSLPLPGCKHTASIGECGAFFLLTVCQFIAPGCSTGNTTAAEGLIDIFALSFSGLKRKLTLAIEEVRDVPHPNQQGIASSTSCASFLIQQSALSPWHASRLTNESMRDNASRPSFSSWQIEDSEELIEFQLDKSRNNLIVVDVVLSLVSAW